MYVFGFFCLIMLPDGSLFVSIYMSGKVWSLDPLDAPPPKNHLWSNIIGASLCTCSKLALQMEEMLFSAKIKSSLKNGVQLKRTLHFNVDLGSKVSPDPSE